MHPCFTPWHIIYHKNLNQIKQNNSNVMMGTFDTVILFLIRILRVTL